MDGHYRAFLLRIWQVGEGQDASWRVMLEDPRTHETVGFDSLTDLLAYLAKMEEKGLWSDRRVSGPGYN